MAAGAVARSVPPDAPAAGDEPRLAKLGGLDPLLDTVSAATRAEHFVHSDFYWKNVIAGDGTLALIDFEHAGAGDKRYDLAKTWVGLTLGASRGGPWSWPARRLLRRVFVRAWRRGYEAAGGQFELDPRFTALAIASHIAWTRGDAGRASGTEPAERDLRRAGSAFARELRRAGLPPLEIPSAPLDRAPLIHSRT